MFRITGTPADSATTAARDIELTYLQSLRERDALRLLDLCIQLQGEHRQRQPRLAHTARQLFMRPELR